MANGTVKRIVIIGAGQAGGEAAARLRGLGFGGEILLLGAERHPPYQRPPLSKKFLTGELPYERLLLRPAELYAQEGIALLTGERAVWIDRAAKRVRLAGGREVGYDALILATGAKPRKLPIPGAEKAGVFELRTLDDVEAMRAAFRPGAKLAVIGAGYIGLEAAASARQLGLDVSVIEAGVRPLGRVTSPEVAEYFMELHAAHGVRFLLGAQAAAILGGDRVEGLELKDGTRLACDCVLVGVGVVPEVELAAACGLAVEDGVLTDEYCRTFDPAIYAVGDCASRPIPLYANRSMRLESVHNAIEGAKIAAAAIVGAPPPVLEAPWFWSDQYDAKLTIAGLFQGYDKIALRGAPSGEGGFAAFYYRDGRMIAVDAVNRPAEYLGAKQLLQRGLSIEPAAAQDVTRPFKTIMAEARAVPAGKG